MERGRGVGGGAGPQQAGAGEGGAETASRGAERTDEEWVALLYMLGQPSELRRRAAWEAVVGLPEMRGAGLAWADVEAEAGAAGWGQGGTAGGRGRCGGGRGGDCDDGGGGGGGGEEGRGGGPGGQGGGA